MNLHNLIQKKKTLTDKMRNLWKVRDSGKEWSEEQSQSYERMSSECDTLNKEIEQRSLFLKQCEEEKPEAEKKFERETSGITIQELCKALLYRKTGNSDFKTDLGRIEEYTRQAIHEHGSRHTNPSSMVIPPRSFSYERDLTTASTSGGASIEDAVQSPTVDKLYANTIFGKLGADIKKVSGDNYVLPKVKTDGTSSTKAEGVALAETDLVLEEEFKLVPHKMGRLIIVTNQWLMQTKDAKVVERALLKEFASYADGQFLNGNGTAPNIRGLLAQTDLQSVASSKANGDTLDYNKLVDIIKTLENSNQNQKPAFVINPNVKAKAKKTLRFAVNGSKALFENNMLADHKTVISTLMSNTVSKGNASNLSNILAVTPASICIAVFGLPAIAISTEGSTWFSEDSSAFRIVSYADMGVIRPDSDHVLLKEIVTEA